jgi:iron complex outermembrane receptor protein
MVPTQLACALALVWALAPPEQPAPPQPPAASRYRTEVEVGRDHGDGLAAQRRLSRRNVGFVTAIDIEAQPGRRPSDDLAGLVSRAPGVTVRSLGGLGQFSAISIRGSTSAQVGVFLDGAPLSGAELGIVDLALQPLDALSRVELYRGYVPIRFGASAIGGALDLIGAVHRGPTKLWLVGGFGSYLAREARFGLALPISRRASLALRVGYAGSRGDFWYFDESGTPLLSDDDALLRRINNDYQRLTASLRIDAELERTRVSQQNQVYVKHQGIPGTATAPSPDARAQTVALRSITRVSTRLEARPGSEVEWIGSAALEHRVLQDLGGQVGLAADDERALTLDAWLSPRVRVALWRGAFVQLLAELRGEWIEIDERISEDPNATASGDATRTRTSVASGAELEQWLFERRVSIVGGVRLDLADSRFAVPTGQGEFDDPGHDRLTMGVTPRLGSKLTIVPGLDLRGSVGRYLRQPTLPELFGDRGYAIGNPGLLPEVGTKLDGGLVLDLEHIGGRELSVFAELAGFVTWSEDLIQWVRSGPIVRPVNVAGARVRGLEAGVSVRGFGRDLGLDVAYTLLDSRNASPEAEQTGKPLPGRPRHSLLVRPSGGHRFVVGRAAIGLEPRVFYELEWIAGTYLDLSGRVELPPRWLHAAGLALRVADRVELTIEGRNLSNRLSSTIAAQVGPRTPYPAPISDFIGFPLPGLSVWATLQVDLDFARKHPKAAT